MSDTIAVNEGAKVSPAVAAVRASLLDGLTPVEVFAAAVDRSPRQIKTWITLGLPIVRVGKTPYVQVRAAREWIMRRSAPPEAPRRGRPRKAA
jgi:hypothetical protein